MLCRQDRHGFSRSLVQPQGRQVLRRYGRQVADVLQLRGEPRLPFAFSRLRRNPVNDLSLRVRSGAIHRRHNQVEQPQVDHQLPAMVR